MALEIERKFLVDGDGWREAPETTRRIVQAYVALDGGTSVRVRIYDDRHARLTVKFGLTRMSRDEFEYPVPLEDARRMVEASRGRLVEKTRHTISLDGFVWEIDAYEGALAGLVIAEVEMRSETDTPTLPDWLGREVTGDSAWSNATLAMQGLPVEVRS
jgi:CYTH domain-containing protein